MDNEENKKTYEHWKKMSKEEYIGFGYTLEGNDTIAKEYLKLIKIDGNWAYEVSGIHENPMLFSFVDKSSNSFICKNEKNDFPKIIEYSFDGKNLNAKISNDNMEIPFRFEKTNNE